MLTGMAALEVEGGKLILDYLNTDCRLLFVHIVLGSNIDKAWVMG